MRCEVRCGSRDGITTPPECLSQQSRLSVSQSVVSDQRSREQPGGGRDGQTTGGSAGPLAPGAAGEDQHRQDKQTQKISS